MPSLSAPIRLVSWDVDGTLYSRSRLLLVLLQNLKSALAAGRGRKALSELRGLWRCRRHVEALRTSGSHAPDLFLLDRRLDLERRWLLPALRQIGPHLAVVRSIEFLDNLSIPQVVFSDYRAQEKLQALGIERYFDAVHAGEMLGAIKPSPKVLERLATEYRLAPSEILHIGDRYRTDGRAAKAAGCAFLRLGWPSCRLSALPRRLGSLRFVPPAQRGSPTSPDRGAET